MNGRFRVKTRDGREIQIETLEALVEMVRAGSVRPEDLVFDSVTGEWAPARSHSLVRQATESLEGTAGPEDGKTEPGRAEEISSDLPSFDILEPEPTSAQAETESLIAELEEERGRDHDLVPDFVQDGAVRVPGSDSTLFLDPGRRRGSRRTSASRPLPPVHDRTLPARPSPPPRRRERGRRDWLLALVLPVVALLASVAVARPEFRADAAEPVAGDADEARRPVSASEEQIRARAYAGFVEAVDGLGASFEFGAVPRAWLEGSYLAEPSAFPEVRQFWERFRSYVETARAEESRLYREAYLAAAARAGMTGPLRSLRMAAALEDFEAGAAARTEHYRRVLELADAALSLDAQLAEVEGQITYEPARGQRLSADPVIEAAGRDPETQARLEATLDRVLRAVYRSGAEGVRDRTYLARWLVDGLEAYAPDGGGAPVP
jgi:hypothetical protein